MAENDTTGEAVPAAKPVSSAPPVAEKKAIPKSEVKFDDMDQAVMAAGRGDAVGRDKNIGFSGAETNRLMSGLHRYYAKNIDRLLASIERLAHPRPRRKKRPDDDSDRLPRRVGGAESPLRKKSPDILTIEAAVAFIADKEAALGVDDFSVLIESLLRPERAVVERSMTSQNSQEGKATLPPPTVLEQWQSDRLRFLEGAGVTLRPGNEGRTLVAFKDDDCRDATISALGTRLDWLGAQAYERFISDELLSHPSSAVREFTLMLGMQKARSDPREAGGRLVCKVGELLLASVNEKSERAGWFSAMLELMWTVPGLHVHVVALLNSFVDTANWRMVRNLANDCRKIDFETRAMPLFDVLERATIRTEADIESLEAQLTLFGFIWDACLDDESPESKAWWETTLRRANSSPPASLLRLLAGVIAISAQFHPFARGYAFNIAVQEHANRPQYDWLMTAGFSRRLRAWGAKAAEDLVYSRLENCVLAWILDGYEKHPAKNADRVLNTLAALPLNWLVTGGANGVDRLAVGVFLLVDWAAVTGVGSGKKQVPAPMSGMMASLADLGGAEALRTCFRNLFLELDRQIQSVQHARFLTFSRFPSLDLTSMTSGERRHVAFLLAARRDAARLLLNKGPDRP